MTSAISDPFTLVAVMDRSLVWEKGQSVRYLSVGLTAAAPCGSS